MPSLPLTWHRPTTGSPAQQRHCIHTKDASLSTQIDTHQHKEHTHTCALAHTHRHAHIRKHTHTHSDALVHMHTCTRHNTQCLCTCAMLRAGAPDPGPADASKEPSYDGRNYVAAEGLFWDLPSGAMRVAATQLQHRVPCWGYVLQVRFPAACCRVWVVFFGWRACAKGRSVVFGACARALKGLNGRWV